MNTEPIRIRLAHSPDSDDLVMWWPLIGISGPGETPPGPVIETGRFEFELVARDVEELNKLAVGGGRGGDGDPLTPALSPEGEREEMHEPLIPVDGGAGGLYDCTAVSAAAYPAMADRYAITRVGGSFGEGYGPRVVVREDSGIADWQGLRGKSIAVPGVNTSAFLTLSLMLGDERGGRGFAHQEMLFSEIPGAVARGEVDAGLLIHEAQLTFADEGLREVANLGVWWEAEVGGPLPLGLNVVRKGLDAEHGVGTVAELSGVLSASVEHAVNVAPGESRRYLQLNKGERTEWDDPELVDRYLAMYVSGLTMEMGERGERALGELLGRGAARGYCAAVNEIEVV